MGLTEWMALRGLSRDELVRQLALSAAPDDHVSYQQLSDVTRLYEPSRHPAAFYLRGDRLVMIYVGGDAARQVSADEVARQLGGPGIELASRAGKTSVMHVYPEHGVALSEEDGQADFVEVFPPTTLQGYRDEIYIDPGPFIR